MVKNLKGRFTLQPSVRQTLILLTPFFFLNDLNAQCGSRLSFTDSGVERAAGALKTFVTNTESQNLVKLSVYLITV